MGKSRNKAKGHCSEAHVYLGRRFIEYYKMTLIFNYRCGFGRIRKILIRDFSNQFVNEFCVLITTRIENRAKMGGNVTEMVMNIENANKHATNYRDHLSILHNIHCSLRIR